MSSGVVNLEMKWYSNVVVDHGIMAPRYREDSRARKQLRIMELFDKKEIVCLFSIEMGSSDVNGKRINAGVKTRIIQTRAPRRISILSGVYEAWQCGFDSCR